MSSVKARVLALLVFALLLAASRLRRRPVPVPRPASFFIATTHTPKVNARWPWSIVVTTPAGRLLPATVSVAVVDPIGGVHPVEYGCCKGKFITNVKIQGALRRLCAVPALGQGVHGSHSGSLVKTRLGTRVVNYWVKAR